MLSFCWTRYREFVIYCLIGGSGVALDCIVFAVLTCGVEWHYQIANVVSVSCGICNNFLWNAFVNFRAADRIWARFLSFYGVGLLGLGVSAALLWLLIGHLGWHELLSKGVILFVVTALQFTLNKYITFRKRHV